MDAPQYAEKRAPVMLPEYVFYGSPTAIKITELPTPVIFFGSRAEADYHAGKGGYTLTAKLKSASTHYGQIQPGEWTTYKDAGYDCLADLESRQYVIINQNCLELVKLTRH